MDGMTATILRPGFLTTVQDLGRPGFRQSGVTSGGAVDSHALRVANLLVGNNESDAGLEITLWGLRIRFSDDRCIAWCGGAFEVTANGEFVPAGRACVLRAGDELSFGGAVPGCRAWLAVSGGIDVPFVLGSRSTDLRGGFGGLGGRALREGDVLSLGEHSAGARELIVRLHNSLSADWGAPSEWALPVPLIGEHILRVVRGSDWTRVSAAALENFLGKPFTVSPDSDRMGARLHGPDLELTDKDLDLISEAVTPGTIQIPQGGQPILLLADCQTIGGYPKLAHVITVDLPLAAQLRPGDRVRFNEVPLAEAHRRLIQRDEDLNRFRIGLSLHQ